MNIFFRLSGVALAFYLNLLSAKAANFTVNVVNNQFQPATININVGDTVVWNWPAGSSGHNVVCDNPLGSGTADPRCGNTPEGPGVTYSGPHTFQFTYETIGTYKYYCSPHRFTFNMTGQVVVATATSNTAPSLTSAANGTSFNYTENTVVSIDGGLTVSDDANLTNATATIAGGFQPAQDQLAYATTAGITGNFNAAAGVLTLSHVGNTPANFQAALRAVKFQNTSDNPTAGNRTVTFQVQDAGGLFSGTSSRVINVQPVNDAPVLTGTGGQLTYTNGSGAVVIDSGLAVTDVDNADLLFATIQITANYVNGEDLLQFTDLPGITGQPFDAGNGTLILSGSSSPANYRAALRSVKYLNASTNPGTASRTVTFRVSDGAASSNPATRSIAVVMANAPPVISIASPVSPAFAVTGGHLKLQASASDPDGTISNVEFFQGGTSLGLLSTAPYNFIVSNLAAGTFSFTAVAADNQGAKSTSSVVQVTTGNLVLLTNSPPQISAGQFQFELTGNGTTHAVQVSSNLVDWATLLSTNFPAGTQVITDGTTDLQLRFYRVITVPQP